MTLMILRLKELSIASIGIFALLFAPFTDVASTPHSSAASDNLDENSICSSDARYTSSSDSCVPPTQLYVDRPTDTSGGFLLFCLCMGRYGNQLEHLLGALSSAKRYSPQRIVVLPSFISWRYGPQSSNTYIPIDAAFDIDRLRQFHRNIITQQEFRELLLSADDETDWKASEATIYCNKYWKHRDPTYTCLDPELNIEGSYWDSFGIKFAKEFFYEANLFELDPSDNPVVIMNSALSAPFPMRTEDEYVAKYLKWTEVVLDRRRSFLSSHEIVDGDVVVAVHLRAGSDWIRACDNVAGMATYMASPQCSDEMRRANMTEGLTHELCLPTADRSLVAGDVCAVLAKANIGNEGKVILFMASDVSNLGEKIVHEYGLSDMFDLLIASPPEGRLSSQGAQAVSEESSFLDLVMMTYADFFLGNCISSFTSFAARMRKEQGIGFDTDFFGLTPPM